jgi:prepilin-type processing-associated H-X9-DG protein
MSFQINSGSTTDIASPHVSGVNLLMADGSVRYVPREMEPSRVRALLTVAGGENTLPP